MALYTLRVTFMPPNFLAPASSAWLIMKVTSATLVKGDRWTGNLLSNIHLCSYRCKVTQLLCSKAGFLESVCNNIVYDIIGKHKNLFYHQLKLNTELISKLS